MDAGGTQEPECTGENSEHRPRPPDGCAVVLLAALSDDPLPLRSTDSLCGLHLMRIHDGRDQTRKALLDFRATRAIAHFHALPFAADQPGLAKRPEVL